MGDDALRWSLSQIDAVIGPRYSFRSLLYSDAGVHVARLFLFLFFLAACRTRVHPARRRGLSLTLEHAAAAGG